MVQQKTGTSSMKTADIEPYYRNPRVGNVPLIVESLKAHGQYKPLVVNLGTKTGRANEVLAGNHLLQAGLKIGLEEMLVHLVDVDDDEAARIVLVDNRASDKGSYDLEGLAGLLGDLPDLDGTGYSDADLTRLLNGLEMGDGVGLTDPDDVPAAPLKTITKTGDVWLLGRHRVVCGDSRDVDVLQSAAGGSSAPIDALWTDPPYGVDYVGKTKEKLTIKNDGAAGLSELLLHSLQAARTVLRDGAPCYIAHADVMRMVLEQAAIDAGYLVRQNLVWVKNTMVLGRSDYHYKHEPILEVEPLPAATPAPEVEPEPETITHEPILYGFNPGAPGRLGRGGDAWYGNNKQTTVFEVAKPAASREHPTMKPTELIVKQLRNSVIRGGTVLDMFGGSGSTLIAAHQLNLEARLVELDPTYVDVICRRFQEHTDVMPIRASDGIAVSFVPEAG